MKVFGTFIIPFEVPQRSVKIKIWVNFFSSTGVGTGRLIKTMWENHVKLKEIRTKSLHFYASWKIERWRKVRIKEYYSSIKFVLFSFVIFFCRPLISLGRFVFPMRFQCFCFVQASPQLNFYKHLKLLLTVDIFVLEVY